MFRPRERAFKQFKCPRPQCVKMRSVARSCAGCLFWLRIIDPFCWLWQWRSALLHTQVGRRKVVVSTAYMDCLFCSSVRFYLIGEIWCCRGKWGWINFTSELYWPNYIWIGRWEISSRYEFPYRQHAARYKKKISLKYSGGKVRREGRYSREWKR